MNRALQKKTSNQCWERMRWKAENREEGATFGGQPEIERKPGWWMNKKQAVSTNLPWVWNRNSSLNTLQSSLPAWLWPHTTPEGLPKHPGEAGGGRWKQRHKFTSFYKFWRENACMFCKWATSSWQLYGCLKCWRMIQLSPIQSVCIFRIPANLF